MTACVTHLRRGNVSIWMMICLLQQRWWPNSRFGHMWQTSQFYRQHVCDMCILLALRISFKSTHLCVTWWINHPLKSMCCNHTTSCILAPVIWLVWRYNTVFFCWNSVFTFVCCLINELSEWLKLQFLTLITLYTISHSQVSLLILWSYWTAAEGFFL